MTPERWAELQATFHALARLDPDERVRRLAEMTDRDLAADVGRLFVAADAADAEGDAGEGALPGVTLEAISAPHAVMPGEVPGFRIRGLLGSGGIGVVYEGEQVSPRRPVAIKLLRIPGEDDAGRRRFELEAEALARLEHPYVARIYASGMAATRAEAEPFIAMELVRGDPIDAYVRRFELDESAILDLFRSVCEGVEAAHAVGIVHRDLKPSNILVDDEGRPRVMDFGVARLADDVDRTRVTVAGGIVGTASYLAPEFLRGDASGVAPTAGVYALGVVL